jgi:uncharacterized membrane protein YfcA
LPSATGFATSVPPHAGSMLPHLTPGQWLLAITAALCSGISKSGFTGLGLVTVIIFARLFPPRESTGLLLPLLICGDIFAVLSFRRHAQWNQIWRMLPPTLVGIVTAFFLMRYIPDARFNAVIGTSVLAMSLLQAGRRFRPSLYQSVPHTRGFAYSLGAGCGLTTMLANGAGPVMALYLLAIDLPKLAFVGTGAWFFLIVNLFKVPFSAGLGLISGYSLLFNLCLVPAVAVGTLLGRWLIHIVPQGLFETLLLIFTTVASLRLIGVF